MLIEDLLLLNDKIKLGPQDKLKLKSLAEKYPFFKKLKALNPVHKNLKKDIKEVLKNSRYWIGKEKEAAKTRIYHEAYHFMMVGIIEEKKFPLAEQAIKDFREYLNKFSDELQNSHEKKRLINELFQKENPGSFLACFLRYESLKLFDVFKDNTLFMQELDFFRGKLKISLFFEEELQEVFKRFSTLPFFNFNWDEFLFASAGATYRVELPTEEELNLGKPIELNTSVITTAADTTESFSVRSMPSSVSMRSTGIGSASFLGTADLPKNSFIKININRRNRDSRAAGFWEKTNTDSENNSNKSTSNDPVQEDKAEKNDSVSTSSSHHG